SISSVSEYVTSPDEPSAFRPGTPSTYLSISVAHVGPKRDVEKMNSPASSSVCVVPYMVAYLSWPMISANLNWKLWTRADIADFVRALLSRPRPIDGVRRLPNGMLTRATSGFL